MITVRLNITWDWICKFSNGKSYLSKLPLTVLVRGEKGQGNKDRAQSWLGLGGVDWIGCISVQGEYLQGHGS